jgi:hypothetical protein
MATHDRSGNAYGSPAKAATNSQRGGFTGRPVTNEYGSGSAKTVGGQQIPRTDSYDKGNQPGGRDSAGGGTVYAYSAKTRKETPVTGEEYRSSIASGQTPNTAKGSKAAYRVANASMKEYGATMNSVKSNYKQARKSGFGPDDARLQALNSGDALRQRTLSQDYSGQNVL